MSEPRTNVMLLVSEDVGRHLGCYGHRPAVTPHLDRLASEGCRFDHALATAPVSAPSRSSLITGRYAWGLGTHHMRSNLVQPPRLFTESMRDAGYYVNWFSKTDFNFEPPAQFAEETDDWQERLAAGRLREPFFVFRNFAVTHESTMWSRPRNGDWGTADDRRAHWHITGRTPCRPEEVTVPAYLPDCPEVRADLTRYYDALAVADARIGKVLEALDASGVAERTLVIYLSDHGRGLVREKRWCYGAGLHMPLVMRWPGQLEAGSVSEELVSWVDLAPTILAATGAQQLEPRDGRVVVGPGKEAEPDCVFAARDRMDEAYDRVRVVRDRRWHYIWNGVPELPYAQRIAYMEHQDTTRAIREWHAAGKLSQEAAQWMAPCKPEEELYDVAGDPDMVRNLAKEPSCAEIMGTMRERLARSTDWDLGRFSERELIERGLVTSILDKYRAWIEPLPDRFRLGGRACTVLEREEMEESLF